MNHLAYFLVFNLCLSYVLAARGHYIDPNRFHIPTADDVTLTPSLGANPWKDTKVLKLSRKVDYYAQQLLSSQAKKLAKLDLDQVDFNNWKSYLIKQFKLKQNTIARYSAQDKKKDLDRFQRNLDSLQAVFEQQRMKSTMQLRNKINRKGSQEVINSLEDATNALDEALSDHSHLLSQRSSVFSKCAEIGGYTQDPSTNVIKLVSTSSFLPVQQWDIEYGKCEGPLQSSNAYDDPSSKLGVLFSKIKDLCNDYNDEGPDSYSDYNDRVLDRYKLMWNDLVVKYTKCVINYKNLKDKTKAVEARMSDLREYIQSVGSSAFVNNDSWKDLDENYDPENDNINSGDLHGILYD